MADLITRVGWEVDQASKGKVKSAVDEIDSQLQKLARANQLKDLAATFREVADVTKNTEFAAAALQEELTKIGATDAEVEGVARAFLGQTDAIEKAAAAAEKLAQKEDAAAAKAIAAAEKKAQKETEAAARATTALEKKSQKEAEAAAKAAAAVEKVAAKEAEAAAKTAAAQKAAIGSATSLQNALGKISRAEQLRQVATEMGTLAKKTGDVGGAVAQLDAKLKGLGANQDEIQGLAGAFQSAAAPDAAGGGIGGRLTKYGSLIRSLPSQQIPGLGIGTDAIGNFARLGGALAGAGEKAGAVATVTTALTPALGATAAGIAAMTLAAAPFVIAIGAIALALKALSDQAAKEAEKINSIVDAQRKVGQDIARGLTSDEANNQLAELIRLRDEEAKRQATLKQSYQDNINTAGALTPVLKVLSGAEDALVGQIDTSTGLVTGYETQIAALTKSIEDGSLAANDAAAAQQKLADSILAAADSAGRQMQAEQRALSATAEQNEKRLGSIEDERAVLEKQIDVLSASGSTSDEVRAKIEALTGQLGQLGQESDFIKNTALAASRQRDAAKEAEKFAEKQAENAQKFAQKTQDNATTAAQRVQDIQTAAADRNKDILFKYTNDLQALTLKAQRDEITAQIKHDREVQDTQIKFFQAEQDAALRQERALEDIQTKAERDQRAALTNRNFLAATTISESLQDAQQDAQTDAERAAQDRQTAAERAAQQRALAETREAEDRARALQNARIDRQAALNIERIEARNAANRQLRDAQDNATRQAQQTALVNQREQDELQKHYQDIANIRSAGYQAELAAMTGGSAAGLTRSGSPSNSSSTLVNDSRSMTFNNNGTLSLDAYRKQYMADLKRLGYLGT